MVNVSFSQEELNVLQWIVFEELQPNFTRPKLFTSRVDIEKLKDILQKINRVIKVP